MKFHRLSSKKLAAGALALMLGLTACSGGSGSGGSGTAGNAETGAAAGANSGGSKSFKLWLGWSATINNDSMVQKYWREKEPGIDVQLEATQGDALTALNLKLNTGGFEDAAIFSRGDVVNSAMVNSGTILPLEQYFNMPDKYPGLASIPKK